MTHFLIRKKIDTLVKMLPQLVIFQLLVLIFNGRTISFLKL